MKIAGIDCSSVVCGYSIYNIENDSFELLDYYSFQSETLVERAIEFRDNVLPLIEKCDLYVLEDRLKQAGKKTTAETLMKLSHINANIELFLYLSNKNKIKKINVRSARKLAYGTIPKETVAKELMFDYLRDTYKEFKPIKKSRGNRYKDEMYDISDSMILALAQSKLIKQ